MRSMTGYGASLDKSRQLELEVHVKSVNGRFLETRFHLPKEYAPFENELRQMFGSSWVRGSIDVYVHRRLGQEQRLRTVQIRHETAAHWTRELKQLQVKLGLKSEVTLRDVLQMPLVMEHQDRVSLLPGELKRVQTQIKLAAQKCLKFRVREGKSLKQELLQQLNDLEKCTVKMNALRKGAQVQFEQRLKSRLATLNVENMEPARLALESALIIDKMDVHEEMVRLGEHIKACRILIQDRGTAGKGKQLDFYCQELLREVNTIGSKSQFAGLTQTVVSAKSVIEKFREQVQNVE